jgi:hypothetical protein
MPNARVAAAQRRSRARRTPKNIGYAAAGGVLRFAVGWQFTDWLIESEVSPARCGSLVPEMPEVAHESVTLLRDTG